MAIPNCNQEIYESGHAVCIMAGANAETIEAFVKCAAGNCGIEMDWHYVGGRAVVKTLGDKEKCLQALRLANIQICPV